MKERLTKLKGQLALVWAAGTSRLQKFWNSERIVAMRNAVREYIDEHRVIVAGIYFGLVFTLLFAVHTAAGGIDKLRTQVKDCGADIAAQVDVIAEQELLIAELQDKLRDYRAAEIRKTRTMAAYKRTFAETERRYNLPKNLLYYVAKVESNFNPDARSHAGAVGIMQIVPRWHPDVDATDPHASIRYAGKYLHQLYKRFGTWADALVAYNWGPQNLEDFGFFNAPESVHDYVITVMAGTFGSESS